MVKFKPQKGKAFDKLPAKTLKTFDTTLYAVSTKYDGNQVFITKTDGLIEFWTSDWKQFYMPRIAGKIYAMLHGSTNCTIIAEMNYGINSGKLGDRTKVQGKITTARVNFTKGLPCSLDEDLVILNIFDFILDGTDLTYNDRMILGKQYNLPLVDTMLMTGANAIIHAKKLIKEGMEGAMLIRPGSFYQKGKRVNYSIKLKYRPTADLLCIGTVPGEGKYTGMIGALVLQDSNSRIVCVGSGLNDIDRKQANSLSYIGKIIEINYEQILDTYIQPTFVQVREDKNESD